MMLDLSRTVRRLPQGRRPAEMTLARPRPATSGESAETEAPPAPAAAAPPAEVDPKLVAERVYELMRRDLRTTLERRA